MREHLPVLPRAMVCVGQGMRFFDHEERMHGLGYATIDLECQPAFLLGWVDLSSRPSGWGFRLATITGLV